MKEYVYKNADNRMRLVIKKDDGSMTSKSYPRVIMERYLGRELEPDDDIHHIDGDPTNNSIENLQIIKHGLHQKQHRLFFDKQVRCQICGNIFLWKGVSQRRYFADLRAGRNRVISCSKKCSAYCGRMKQLGREIKFYDSNIEE